MWAESAVKPVTIAAAPVRTTIMTTGMVTRRLGLGATSSGSAKGFECRPAATYPAVPRANTEISGKTE